MFEINKEKFGAFVAELRKEKGFTQKELAQRLFISDKAISKWETGVSIPDTALLIPLADLLGVSVTELLTSSKMTQGDSLEKDKVEEIVKTAITYTDKNVERAYQVTGKWIAWYMVSLLMGCSGLFLNDVTRQPCLEILRTIVCLCAVFGAYFCCFVKMKLPAFYDENHVSVFQDGPFRMNMWGVRFHNRNWPYIVKAIRIGMCLSMIIFPAVNFVAGSAARKGWAAVGNYIWLTVFLCSLFLPVYAAAKKYE